MCKGCDGVGICEHGRQRSQCKECGLGGLRLIVALEQPVVVLEDVHTQPVPLHLRREPSGVTHTLARTGAASPCVGTHPTAQRVP